MDDIQWRVRHNLYYSNFLQTLWLALKVVSVCYRSEIKDNSEKGKTHETQHTWKRPVSAWTRKGPCLSFCVFLWMCWCLYLCLCVKQWASRCNCTHKWPQALWAEQGYNLGKQVEKEAASWPNSPQVTVKPVDLSQAALTGEDGQFALSGDSLGRFELWEQLGLSTD